MTKKESVGFGIAGFVLGLVSLLLFFIFFISPFLSILGIIFSSMQLKKKSTGLAIAGLIISIIALILSISVFALLIFATNDAQSFDLGEINQTVVLVKNNYEYVDGKYTYKQSVGGSGVIYYQKDGVIRIITNRHVADCSYNSDCGQLVNQTISVRTYDGLFHNVSRVYIAKDGIDLSILEIQTDKKYPVADISSDISVGDNVVAIGYPAFSSNAREFSISFGSITKTRNLLTTEGYDFEAIDSDAYTYFGSSGGGLFDDSKKLIGITTWGNDKYSYAINIKYLAPLNEFNTCKGGEYYYESRGCLPYCNGIISEDNLCAMPCTDFYCNSEPIFANDNSCIDSSLILGNDGFCHEACGSTKSYCPNGYNYCFEDKCTSCPQGYILYDDGRCY